MRSKLRAPRRSDASSTRVVDPLDRAGLLSFCARRPRLLAGRFSLAAPAGPRSRRGTRTAMLYLRISRMREFVCLREKAASVRVIRVLPLSSCPRALDRRRLGFRVHHRSVSMGGLAGAGLLALTNTTLLVSTADRRLSAVARLWLRRRPPRGDARTTAFGLCSQGPQGSCADLYQQRARCAALLRPWTSVSVTKQPSGRIKDVRTSRRGPASS